MASSGVKTLDRCNEEFLKLKKDKDLKYIIFKIVDHDNKPLSAIDVECTKTAQIPKAKMHSETSDDFQEYLDEQKKVFKEFTSKLGDAATNKECRFAVFDYHYLLGNGAHGSSIVFFSWNPEDAPVKQKMVYTTSASNFKKHLTGIHINIEAHSFDDLEDSEVKERCLKHNRAT